jgi:hypothetical protein
MGPNDRSGHYSPQPFRSNRVVEVMGDGPAQAIVLDSHSPAQHRRLPAEPFLRPDDEAAEFLGAPAHDRHQLHRVVLADPVRSDRQIRTEQTVDDIRTMPESRCPIEQRQHSVEIGICGICAHES